MSRFIYSFLKLYFQIAVLVAEYRTASSNNDFGYSIFFHLVAGTVCEDIQWKSGSRGEDNRQGLSCLSNLTSVLGGNKISFALLNKILKANLHCILFF